MDTRLIPLNAFIALASPSGTSWPNPLHSAGYVLEALELPLDTAGGRVVADAVAFSSGMNRFLVVETKSGRNIPPDQAQRYGQVDAHQLVRYTGVTVARDDEVTVEPLYVCLADNVDRILTGLQVAECTYPVLAVSDDQITLHGDVPSPQDFADIFSSPVPTTGWPPTIIRVDEHSEASEFDMIASQALIAAVNLGATVPISVVDLAARAIPHLNFYGTRYRNSLIKKVEQALERLCADSPANFRFRGRTASRDYSLVEVIDSPERADPRGRTQRYQAIRRHSRGQALSEPSSPPQMALFDSVDLGTELEEPEDSGSDAAQDGHEGGEA